MKIMDLKVGDVLRWRDLPPRHVRGFIDNLVVVRFWSRYKQRWIYEIESEYWHFLDSPETKILRK